MKQSFYSVTAALLVFLFAGCEATDESIISVTDSVIPQTQDISPENKLYEPELPGYFVAQLEEYESVEINTYTVDFLGRTVKGTGENVSTTFSYRVSGGGVTPQLDSFFLQLPECSGDVAAWLPTQASDLYDDAIKWNNSVSKDGTQDYSITFKGDVPLGIINSTVIRGGVPETKEVLGPCAGVFTLSGSIFIDANTDGIKQSSESGISSFQIDLYDGSDKKIGTVPTSANGSYSFLVLKGNYKIAVNEDLFNDNNYTATGDTSLEIEDVTANMSGYNFGYSVNTSNIIKELEEKIIVVNTEPTKFWVQQIKNAGKGGSMYSKEEIRAFLVSIESLLLAEPFQFGDRKEAEALSILSRPRNDLDLFLQQLLTAELNIVSGRGAIDQSTNTQNAGFNNALLIYAEAVACQELGSCPAEDVRASTRATEVKAIRSSDTRMLSSFNGSGGV